VQNTSLRELHLENNSNETDDGDIALALKVQNTTLRELDLDFNKIIVSGAVELSLNITLRKLHLGGNQITDHAVSFYLLLLH
jgi:Leucine-rich repeat (LRR) protein